MKKDLSYIIIDILQKTVETFICLICYFRCPCQLMVNVDSGEILLQLVEPVLPGSRIVN